MQEPTRLFDLLEWRKELHPERPVFKFKENGEWILIDYKTDHDTNPETFVPRHEIQMNWYRTALERLTRIRVKEMWLYALRAGLAFPVERREVVENT